MRPPSVDALARSLAHTGLPHPLLVDVARQAIASGEAETAAERAAALAERRARSLLRPVINATGVLLHTNLGRAPIAVTAEARYANLELDLESGSRGSRSAHAASLLAQAAGAEAALVVNNGAAAVLLVLAALAAGQSVPVSRGELVEIGGGFRVPDVMAQSGSHLVEVGTTNRTRLRDYEVAIDDSTALVLKVHQSNYRIVGFTETVDVPALARLGPPVAVDLGSGLLDTACPWLPGGPPAWLRDEPAVRQTLAAGAAIVTFSGDKLLGGPQAGIIAGRRDLVERCSRHPLARALRPGGLVLAALQETALAYLRRDAGSTIPFWRMATTDAGVLRIRAATLVRTLAGATVVDCESVAGGGTLPGITIPSAGVALAGDRTGELRAGDPPVIARVVDGRTLLDVRTVDPGDDELVAKALAALTTDRQP